MNAEELERSLEEIRIAVRSNEQLRAHFYAHAIWGELFPAPESHLAGRPLWENRVAVQIAAAKPMQVSQFIEHVYGDLIAKGDIGEDDLNAYDPKLLATYRSMLSVHPERRVPGLVQVRVPYWQRRLLNVSEQTTHKETIAVAVALRRAVAARRKTKPKAP
jgi:hypothetical protein